MKRNIKIAAGSKHSSITAIWIGTLTAVLLSIALTALLTNLVVNGQIGETKTSIFIFVIRAVSVFIGGILGAAIIKEK